MEHHRRAAIRAVLGPTNTGKTHLAVERLLAHTSGMIGFPLRLLAREVYDRVVRLRGADAAALVTGEERIWPATARYLLCTAEAMPVAGMSVRANNAGDGRRDPADMSFVALDEGQIAADRERGHVFTTRLLHARGRDETMILGSDALAPLVKGLIPHVEVDGRPRFSTLSYAGSRKLSRLPPRSAIIAFSVEEVYAIAEALRRFSGGAAVVMGALSPRTRNAQVAMFQAGEVDYLVATDAVGMGLNLDVDHVAFASLSKFDGVRQRRLTVAEIAQIAGRAGRHQRDGTFGTIGEEAALTDEEVAAVEGHHVPPLDWAYWRDHTPPMDSVASLIAGLEAAPNHAMLRAAPEGSDLAVLRRLAEDDAAMAPVDGPAAVRRLWDACSLPDFRKAGPEAHGRMVARVWRDLSGPAGRVDSDWFAGQLAALDTADGSVEVLADRIAAVRSFCYMAQRADWLADPVAMADTAQGVETRLSDALHAALTQRFVDRRTSVLLRAIGMGADALPVAVDDATGIVRVDGEVIGHLDGFRFRPDPSARVRDQKLVLSAAEKYLAVELARRASLLAVAPADDLSLLVEPGQEPRIVWQGMVVAKLLRGKHLLSPRIDPVADIAALDAAIVTAVRARMEGFVDGRIGKHLRALVAMAAQARLAETPPVLRALFASVVDGCGTVPRSEVADAVASLTHDGRQQLRAARVRLGNVHLYVVDALRPAALAWLTALRAAWREEGCGATLSSGAAVVPVAQVAAPMIGYVRLVDSLVRIDILERVGEEGHRLRTGMPSLVKRKGKAVAEPAAAAPAPDAVSESAPDVAPDLSDAATTSDVAAEPVVAAEPSPPADVDVPATAPATVPAADAPPHPKAFRINPELARSIGLTLADRMAAMRIHGFRLASDGPAPTQEQEAATWWRWGGGQRRQDGSRRGRPGNRRGNHAGAERQDGNRSGAAGRGSGRDAEGGKRRDGRGNESGNESGGGRGKDRGNGRGKGFGQERGAGAGQRRDRSGPDASRLRTPRAGGPVDRNAPRGRDDRAGRPAAHTPSPPSHRPATGSPFADLKAMMEQRSAQRDGAGPGAQDGGDS